MYNDINFLEVMRKRDGLESLRLKEKCDDKSEIIETKKENSCD